MRRLGRWSRVQCQHGLNGVTGQAFLGITCTKTIIRFTFFFKNSSWTYPCNRNDSNFSCGIRKPLLDFGHCTPDCVVQFCNIFLMCYVIIFYCRNITYREENYLYLYMYGIFFITVVREKEKKYNCTWESIF